MTGHLDPGLLTGTSAEFLGKKPLPRILRTRPAVVILGPSGVGKSRVAEHLAPGAPVLSSSEGDDVLVERVRTGFWPPSVSTPMAVVFDGVWLHAREGAIRLIAELCRFRADLGRRTILIESDPGSLEPLLPVVEAGSLVILGLRFPRGRRARIRVAKQLALLHELPSTAIRGSELLKPWRYDTVLAYLKDNA